MNNEEQKNVTKIISEVENFIAGRKYDVGLATSALCFVIKDLLIQGIEARPEVKHTLVKYTNATLNLVMNDVDRHLKTSE